MPLSFIDDIQFVITTTFVTHQRKWNPKRLRQPILQIRTARDPFVTFSHIFIFKKGPICDCPLWMTALKIFTF